LPELNVMMMIIDMHTDQLMPLPLTVSCFSEIPIGFTFLVRAHPGSPGQRAVKWVCVCVRACVCVRVCTCSLASDVVILVLSAPVCQPSSTRFTRCEQVPGGGRPRVVSSSGRVRLVSLQSDAVSNVVASDASAAHGRVCVK